VRAIVNTSPGKLEMLEVATPAPGPGQVRIRTAACGICATDLEMIGGWERTGFPSIPGHEWSGTVDAAGEGVGESLVGRPCVGENVLADGGEVGFEHPGGYGEYLLTSASNIHLLPDRFPMYIAALIEPLGVCVRGLHRLRPDAKGPVLIIGDGPIGLMMCMLMRRRGLETMLLGGRPERLELALSFGASKCLNYHDLAGELSEEVVTAAGTQFPTILECSGSSDAMNACFELAAREGRVLMLGDYAHATAGFRWNRVLWQEIELIGSNASAGAWQEATELAVEKSLPLGSIITHRVSAAEFELGYNLARDRQSGAIKIVMEWT